MTEDIIGLALGEAMDVVGWDEEEPPSRAIWEWVRQATAAIHALEREALDLREEVQRLRDVEHERHVEVPR